MRSVLTLLALNVLAGCGEVERPASPPPASGGTRLVVELRPDGERGPVRRRELRELPPGVSPEDLAPVAGDVACTEIYGGPQTARVTGTLRGSRIDARFSRSDGCEIARWDKLVPLLGDAGGVTAPPP